MVQVIQVDSASAMNHLLYPEQNPMNFTYLQNQFTQLSNMVGNVSNQFIDSAKQAFEAAYNSEIITKAKLALSSIGAMFHPNTIMPLQTLDELRQAQPMMQRYIMAMPEIRERYQEQRCSGYVDTYVDVEPGGSGWNHYDYRRVMDRLISYNEHVEGSTEEPRWDSWQCLEELREGDRPLSIFEQSHILSTWEIARAFMDAGEDVTCIEGGKL